MPLIDVPTVHAVTDLATLSAPDFASRAGRVLEALGASGAVHLRAGPAPARGAGGLLYALALELAPIAARTGGWLVINDRIDVALALVRRGGNPGLTVGAQLSQRSLAAADARRVAAATAGVSPAVRSPTDSDAPRLRLGVSVHGASEAAVAVAGGAEWLLAGSVFPTASHPGLAARGVELIGELGAVGIPVVAIGGVTPDRVGALVARGWHGVAAIGGIWGSEDPGEAARSYLEGMTLPPPI
jgi:thiamine monophosphate synthase